MGEVRDILKDADRTMEQSERGSTIVGRLISRVRRKYRATSLRNNMNALDAQIERASFKFLHLISAPSALKIEDILEPKIDNPSLLSFTGAVFRPMTNAPALTNTVKLDFDAKDADRETRHSRG